MGRARSTKNGGWLGMRGAVYTRPRRGLVVNFVVLLKGAMLVRCQMANKNRNRTVVGRGKGGRNSELAYVLLMGFAFFI